TGYEVSLNGGQTFSSPSAGTTGLSHTVTGLQAGQHVSIIVRAKGASSCQTSANSATVTGIPKFNQPGRIWVPNAFTPNGDGNNDMAMVFGHDIKSLTFRVYNQWGQLYFISTQQSLGWDGTYKGVKQPVGVYVYYVEGVMNSGEKVNMKGTITLLR
ncbi:MAG: gliding motility-associated C-terminal domain-containing protein, partial [Mucilaginibacter polytrichastri]|nr:gliding motility-associated C-terminal domain-containing protein [Mucilaginibacter polytrichastri]